MLVSKIVMTYHVYKLNMNKLKIFGKEKPCFYKNLRFCFANILLN